MRRERALRIVLVIVGLIFLAGVYPLITSVREGWQANKEDSLPMGSVSMSCRGFSCCWRLVIRRQIAA
jgi:hypothetical protein